MSYPSMMDIRNHPHNYVSISSRRKVQSDLAYPVLCYPDPSPSGRKSLVTDLQHINKKFHGSRETLQPSFPHPPWERHHPLGSKAQMQRLNGGRWVDQTHHQVVKDRSPIRAYAMHTYSMCVRLPGSLAYPDIFVENESVRLGEVWLYMHVEPCDLPFLQRFSWRKHRTTAHSQLH